MSEEGLSSNNLIYKRIKISKFGLLNFSYPDLSPNDRFLLPYEKIEYNNLINYTNISKKYDTSYTIIVKVRSRSNINLVEVIFFSSAKSEILEIIKFESFDNDDFKNQLFNLIR